MAGGRVFMDRGSGFLCTQPKLSPSKDLSLVLTCFCSLKCVLKCSLNPDKLNEILGIKGKNWSSLSRTTPDTCEIQFCIQHIIFFELKMRFIFF
ncbi:hypothetical protein NIES4103_46370 [Nostoc sp. NIES-4103]|nr:hypothetical protein NIES4103_46370 [Nostoc sp. NIES-4103]